MKIANTLSDRQMLLSLMGLALLLCLPMIIFDREPGNDVAAVYAPMIRELAAGNWEFGFNAERPPIFTLVGGIFGALGFDGFTAAKLASSLFFCLTLLPLYHLVDQLFNRRTAVVAGVMFVFCSYLLRYAGTGTRTTAKTFFLTLTVVALVGFFRKRSWQYALLGGAAAAGLLLTRNEGIGLAPLALLLLAAPAIRPSPDQGRAGVLTKAAAATVLFLVLVSPWLAYEYRCTGYLVTDSAQIKQFKFIKHRFFTPSNSPHGQAANSVIPIPTADRRQFDLRRIFVGGIKGLYPYYLIFVLPVLVWRVKRRQWNRFDSFLLAWIIGHTVIMLALTGIAGYPRRRYVLPVIPLMLGWGAAGVIASYRFLKRKFPRRGERIAHLVITVALLFFVWDGTMKARPSWRLRKRRYSQAVRETAAWLRENGRGRVLEKHRPLDKQFTKMYHNGRLPVVCSAEPQITYFAESDLTCPKGLGLLSVKQFSQFCARNRVNFIVVERRLLEQCPELASLETLPPEFSLEYSKWRHLERPIWLLGYGPSLKAAPSP